MDENLSILGHDLRNELSAIAGLAELIEVASKDSEIKEYARQIRNHNHFMVDLVNGMVVSAKAGGIKPTLMPMSVWNLVGDVTAGLMVGADRPPVALVALKEIPEEIISDALMLRQILTNLVGNAVRFTREGGVRVHLEFESERRVMRFTISDTGPGMTTKQLAQLFQPDRNIHRDEATPGGHGLGLWIARKMVDHLGGQISVRSMVGHGTVIAVQIPCEVAENSRMLSEQELRQAMVVGRSIGTAPRECFAGMRVLVADDVSANRLIAATLLKRRGASVSLAVDGIEAVRLAQVAQEGGRPFDLILMDYHMPNMDGAVAANILRKDGCVAPILCWTAASSPSLSRMPDVFSTVMDKPLESEKFYAVLERYLGGTSQQRRMAQ